MQNIDEVINQVLEIKIETTAQRRLEFNRAMKARLVGKRGFKRLFEIIRMMPATYKFYRDESA